MKITQSLKPGMENDEVKRLQEELKAIGYDPGTIDGKYGTATEAAVKKFQKDKGLTEDGIVGPETARAINEVFDALPKTGTPGAPPKSPAGGVATPAEIDQITRVNEALEKLKGKMTKEQQEEYDKLEKRKIDALLKGLKKALDGMDKIGWFERIKATREGTTAEKLNPKTAYGFDTDEDKFVALPCTKAKGRWIEIVLPDGTTAVVPVGDIGPWNGGGTKAEPRKYDDCYWETGSRPQSESGTDKRGRKTNGAGIDLSQHLWVQLGLPEKGGETTVKWRFVDPPADGEVDIAHPDGSHDKHKNKGG